VVLDVLSMNLLFVFVCCDVPVNVTEHIVTFSLCVDSTVDVVVDLNHTDVPDVHAYVDHDLVSPDSDRLHLPVVSDASRTAGLYVMSSCQLNQLR